MDRISINGEQFEVETKGSGEPLVLIHGSISGETFDCLLKEPALTERYRVINYHRRGFLGSPKHARPCSLKQQAADALGVINAVAGGRAHVAGHSYGGATLLQLALDASDAVQTLALLEPPLDVPSAPEFFGQMDPVNAVYASGDKMGATRGFLEIALSPGYEAKTAGHLADGWLERAAADIDGFFQVELPALAEWHFTEEEARRIAQPVLSVVGADSPIFFVEGDQLIRRLLPQAETLVVPGATHGLQYMNPRFVAEGLAAFLAKHPMKAAAGTRG
jgi:pimeloyl-ACP methyl ester carboxylesterase